MSLKVKLETKNAKVPLRNEGDAGYDLFSDKDYVVPAGGKEMINTGISVAIPSGHYGRIAPRSGLAWKNSIDVGAGVIDMSYRGLVKVILFNHSKKDYAIKQGDRIAQLILEKISTPEIEVVTSFESTTRGDNGFGSSGN